MKASRILLITLLLLLLVAAGWAYADRGAWAEPALEASASAAMPLRMALHGLRSCDATDREAPWAKWDEIEPHRLFAVPVLTHPFDTQFLPDQSHRVPWQQRHEPWGLELTIRVDADGKPSCASVDAVGDETRPLNSARRALLLSIADWRYRPFLHEGRPTAVIVHEQVREQEAPESRVPMPVAPMSQVRIEMERGACFGPCPIYRVIVHGDGRVEYEGKHFVAVEGKQSWRIPEADVRRLLDEARRLDLWSMRSDYFGQVTDHPTTRLLLSLGTEQHTISKNAGERAGLPVAVDEFESKLDALSGALARIEGKRGETQ